MIDALIAWLQAQITTNDVFAGLVGGSVIGSALFAVRSLPNRLWRVCLLQLTAEVVIYNDDEAFEWVSLWLARTPYAKRARRLRFTTTLWLDEGGSKATWNLSPGHGAHLLWHGSRPVWIERGTPEGQAPGSSNRTKETISIRTIGRSPAPLRALIAGAQGLQRDGNRIEVYQRAQSYWRLSARKAPRDLESVILPRDQVDRIVQDAERFFGAEPWYAERGVPYRRGYLLSGPPGCGKTSLVIALASRFRRPIYALNLGSIWSDTSLFDALAEAPAHAVLLIEDIDATGASQARRRGRSNRPAAPGEPSADTPDQPEESGITLSGLLNALDGVATTDGRLLIMTTNHPEKLDPALIRPGRADLHEVVGPLEAHDAARLFLRFYPGEDDGAAELARAMGDRRVPAAELQGVFLSHADDPWSAVLAVAHRFIRSDAA